MKTVSYGVKKMNTNNGSWTRNEMAKSAPNVEVWMVYEDLMTGLLTKRLFERLVRANSLVFRFICHLWRFEILQSQELREATAEEAVRADMTIIATHGDRELPRTIKEWIESWVFKKMDASALVTLVEVDNRHWHGAGTIRSYLLEVADMGKMSFFYQEIHRPNGNADLRSKQPRIKSANGRRYGRETSRRLCQYETGGPINGSVGSGNSLMMCSLAHKEEAR